MVGLSIRYEVRSMIFAEERRRGEVRLNIVEAAIARIDRRRCPVDPYCLLQEVCAASSSFRNTISYVQTLTTNRSWADSMIDIALIEKTVKSP